MLHRRDARRRRGLGLVGIMIVADRLAAAGQGESCESGGEEEAAHARLVARRGRKIYGGRDGRRQEGAAMARWLMKSEPASYGWADLVRDGAAEWDGVRNPAARLHLKAMRAGDE